MLFLLLARRPTVAECCRSGDRLMILKCPYSAHELLAILSEQVDRLPLFPRCLITLNAFRYRGTSTVCGSIGISEFELRNRANPYFSLRAKGTLNKAPTGTEIRITFRKPMFQDFLGSILFRRYENDKKVIVGFLKEWLKAEEKADQPTPLNA